MMKLRRRHRVAKNENDREYLIENNTEHDYSKIRRMVWKFAKSTWKAFKIGFKTTVTSQAFCFEPTAVATTIIEYQTQKRERRRSMSD